MLWRLKDDVFAFTVEMPQKSLTGRGMLSALDSLFDPLGFVSPVILEGRMMLRNLCRRKAGWDEEVTSSEAERWLQWINSLPALNDLHIPRCFNSTGFRNLRSIEIHNFSDASLFADGACSYLRLVDCNGSCDCSLVIGKARLAPNNAVSIQRLELTAAVLAVRLNNVVVKEMDLASPCESHFWTDSTAGLHCIHNKDKRFPIFVANRLAVIEKDRDESLWHYVPSKLNPADMASRGIPAEDSAKLRVLLSGPEFLLDWNARTHWEEPAT